MHPINAYGTEEQKQKYLPQLGTDIGILCRGTLKESMLTHTLLLE